jgi:hypothetical protein
MSDEQQRRQIPQMKSDGLYKEEVFTDRMIGSIRRLLPVTQDGNPDTARPMLFVGSTQLMTNAGPLPLTFEIHATTLSEAVSRFSDAAERALQDTLREIAEMQREQQSGLVLPGDEMRGMGGGGLGGLGGLGRR